MNTSNALSGERRAGTVGFPIAGGWKLKITEQQRRAQLGQRGTDPGRESQVSRAELFKRLLANARKNGGRTPAQTGSSSPKILGRLTAMGLLGRIRSRPTRSHHLRRIQHLSPKRSNCCWIRRDGVPGKAQSRRTTPPDFWRETVGRGHQSSPMGRRRNQTLAWPSSGQYQQISWHASSRPQTTDRVCPKYQRNTWAPKYRKRPLRDRLVGCFQALEGPRVGS